MGKINLLEEGAEGARGRKKSHEWERKPKVGRLLGDKDLLSEIKSQEASRAAALHIGSRLPKGARPKDVVCGKSAPNNKPKENKPAPEIGSAPVADAKEPLPVESEEEKLTKLEERIQSDEFSDTEREFFDAMVEKYPHELQVAKEKIEKKGGVVDEKWAALVRTSYINERKRLGLEKNRWGSKIPFVPEKAELFERYLNLKLPVGIPEEKNNENNNNSMEETPLTNTEEKGIKTEFSSEQQKVISLMRVKMKIYEDRITDLYNQRGESEHLTATVAAGIMEEFVSRLFARMRDQGIFDPALKDGIIANLLNTKF